VRNLRRLIVVSLLVMRCSGKISRGAPAELRLSPAVDNKKNTALQVSIAIRIWGNVPCNAEDEGATLPFLSR
jgi:hypothetical protein